MIDFLYLVIIAQFLVIASMIINHKQERRDLLNRLMAKDLPEYRDRPRLGNIGNVVKRHLEKQREERKNRNREE